MTENQTLTTDSRKLALIRELVNEQAEDNGLWFRALTATEAYLQQRLRELHHLIEEHTDP